MCIWLYAYMFIEVSMLHWIFLWFSSEMLPFYYKVFFFQFFYFWYWDHCGGNAIHYSVPCIRPTCFFSASVLVFFFFNICSWCDRLSAAINLLLFVYVFVCKFVNFFIRQPFLAWTHFHNACCVTKPLYMCNRYKKIKLLYKYTFTYSHKMLLPKPTIIMMIIGRVTKNLHKNYANFKIIVSFKTFS